MIRVVFDVNVIISALLFAGSVPRMALDRALSQGTILISDALSEELRRVLARSRFDRYASLEDREDFFDGLIRVSELVEITESVQVCRDPQDNHVLELAVSGDATFIVTGDTDLLVLDPFRGVAIATPAEFLDLAV